MRGKRFSVNKFLIAAVIVFLFVSSLAYSGSVVNSRHDMSYVTNIPDMLLGGNPAYMNDYGEVCVYCHTPHGANDIAPLWNRNTPTSSYTIYNVTISPTMDSAVDQPNGISLACLSCHDGTVAVDSIINQPNTGVYTAPGHMQMTSVGANCGQCHPGASGHDASKSYLGTNLANDHPISMSYNDLSSQFGSEFNTPDDIQKGWTGNDVKLFSGYVECPSCHDVHDPDISPFLRISNDNSALCTKCHIK